MWAGCWMSQPLLLLQHQARMSQQEATQQHSSKSGSHSFKGECHSYSEGSIPSEWYQDLAAKRGRRGDYKLDAINNQRISGDRKHREVTVLWRNCLVMGCSPVALTHCRAEEQHRTPSTGLWESSAGRQHWPALISHILGPKALPPSEAHQSLVQPTVLQLGEKPGLFTPACRPQQEPLYLTSALDGHWWLTSFLLAPFAIRTCCTNSPKTTLPTLIQIRSLLTFLAIARLKLIQKV